MTREHKKGFSTAYIVKKKKKKKNQQVARVHLRLDILQAPTANRRSVCKKKYMRGYGLGSKIITIKTKKNLHTT